jgi:phosphatidylinositol alpha-1,6-mannosyltransferase
VSDHIRFIGSVPWDEAPQWFDAADVFAGPSRTRLAGLEPEALGIVFLEAQAAGKPVLVGASGGAVETVQHEITGYGVDPHDPADIAARAITLLSDRDRAREMGRAGRAWVEREWTWDASVSTLRSLLHTS